MVDFVQRSATGAPTHKLLSLGELGVYLELLPESASSAAAAPPNGYRHSQHPP